MPVEHDSEQLDDLDFNNSIIQASEDGDIFDVRTANSRKRFKEGELPPEELPNEGAGEKSEDDNVTDHVTPFIVGYRRMPNLL